MGNAAVTGSNTKSAADDVAAPRSHGAAGPKKLKKERSKTGSRQAERVGPYSATLGTTAVPSARSGSSSHIGDASGTGLSLTGSAGGGWDPARATSVSEGDTTAYSPQDTNEDSAHQQAVADLPLPAAPASVPAPPPPPPPPPPPGPPPVDKRTPEGSSTAAHPTTAAPVASAATNGQDITLGAPADWESSTLAPPLSGALGKLTASDLEVEAAEPEQTGQGRSGLAIPDQVHQESEPANAQHNGDQETIPTSVGASASPQPVPPPTVVRSTWTPPSMQGGHRSMSGVKDNSPQPSNVQHRWRQHNHDPHVAHQELPDLQPYPSGTDSRVAVHGGTSTSTSVSSVEQARSTVSTTMLPDLRTPALVRREQRVPHGASSLSHSSVQAGPVPPSQLALPAQPLTGRTADPPSWHQTVPQPSVPASSLAMLDDVKVALQLYQEIQKQYYLDFYTRIFQQQKQQQQQKEQQREHIRTSLLHREAELPSNTAPAIPVAHQPAEAPNAQHPVLRVHNWAPAVAKQVHQRVPTTSVDLTRSLSPRSSVRFSSVPVVRGEASLRSSHRATSPWRESTPHWQRTQGQHEPRRRSPSSRSRAERMAAAKAYAMNH